MKHLLLFFLACISRFSWAQRVSMDSLINKASLRWTVYNLSADSMRGRYTGMPETKLAAAFIANRFAEAGLKPVAGADGFFDHYPIKFKRNGDTIQVQAINVIGALKGNESPDSIVVLCAHYDHIGVETEPEKGQTDTVYNGANDNASGVALLIELAKFYAAIGTNRYTLVFVAFSGEELGLLGSEHLAASMNQGQIKAVLNFDMMGRPLNAWTWKCMVVAENANPIIRRLNKKIYPKNDFFMEDMFPLQGLFYRSDHYSFTEVKNRIFFTATSDSDKHYHRVSDEYRTIDFDFLLQASRNIATACRLFTE